MRRIHLDDFNKIAYYAFVQRENELWVSNIRFNGLFRIDMESEDVEFMGRFPGYADDFIGLHERAFLYGKKIFFFPQHGESVDVFDLITCKFYRYDNREWKSKKERSIIDVYLKDDVFYILPRFPDMPIVKFSAKSELFIENIKLKKANYNVSNEKENLTIGTCRDDNKIYFPIFNTNKIACFDLDTEREEIYILKNVVSIKSTIMFDGTYFWIEADGDILAFEKNFITKYRYTACVSNAELTIASFLKVIDTVYAFPLWLGNIKKINLKKKKISEIDIPKEKMRKVNDEISNWRDIKVTSQWRDYIIIHPVSLDAAILIHTKSGKITTKQLTAPKESIPKLIFRPDKIISEDKNLDLFITYIFKCYYSSDRNEESRKIGQEIWSRLAGSEIFGNR